VKQFFFHIILIILILVPACRNKNSSIITCDLKRSDYLETIDAPGTIQAVNNVFMVTPDVYASNVKVAHLVDEGVYVKKGDTVCILDAPELIQNFESLNTDLEKMEADLKKLEADNAMKLSMLKAQVETNEARMAISNLDSIQIKFATPVKQRLLALEMEKAGIEKKKLQKKYAAQTRINNSELTQMKSRITIHKSQMQIIQQQINSLTIVTSTDGMVIHATLPDYIASFGILSNKIEEGSSVWNNMTLVQIPDLNQMQVSVEVPEADYKRMKEEQKVQIWVEAVKSLYTTGKIKRKILAGKNINKEVAVKTYEVIISVDSCHLKMKPGLSARCRIIIDQVKDTVVVPAAAIFTRDSSKIVYVAEDGKFIPVTVETGFSSSSRSIVSKGLTGNETIALMEPPHYLIRKKAIYEIEKTIKSGICEKDSVIK
jgi:HlyD family secretion protein